MSIQTTSESKSLVSDFGVPQVVSGRVDFVWKATYLSFRVLSLNLCERQL